MICCVDSSILLAILFAEADAAEARAAWIAGDHRIASILLAAETLVVLRRAHAAARPALGPGWLLERERARATLLEEAHLLDVDAGILETIAVHRELAVCRTLDAIHLATALNVRDAGFGSDVVVASLDRPMRQVARKLRFRLLPAALPRADGPDPG
jgi:predicted nucleic acid-binding protein